MSILAYIEFAQASATAPTFARIWRSTLGLVGTWEELHPPPPNEADPKLTDETSFFFNRIGAIRDQVALIGQNGPQPVSAFACTQYTPIAGSPDGGDTWTGRSADCATDWPDIPGGQSAWNVADWLAVSPSLVFAICQYPTYNDFGFTVLSLLRSTNGGATFSPYVPTGIDDQFGCVTGLKLASGRLLLSKEKNGAYLFATLYKSDDNGATWTVVNTPNIRGGFNTKNPPQIVQTPTGRVVALAAQRTGGDSKPGLYYSDNDGDSWTAVASNLTPVTCMDLNALFGTNAVGWNSAVVTGNVIVAALSGTLGGGPPPAAFRPFVMSIDNGLTFGVIGTYTTTPDPQFTGSCLQMTVADDGAVLALLGRIGTNTPGEAAFTIWRGVVNASETDITWDIVLQENVEIDLTACNKGWIYNVGSFTTPIEVTPGVVTSVWEVLPFGECICPPLVNDAGEVLTIRTGHCPDCLPQPFNPILTADSERKSVSVPVTNNVIQFFLQDDQETLAVLVNDLGNILQVITTALVLSKSDAVLFGHYLGWTMKGHDAPFRLETVEMQYAPTREWDATP